MAWLVFMALACLAGIAEAVRNGEIALAWGLAAALQFAAALVVVFWQRIR